MLLGVIDDRSRLVCHRQWYLDETAHSLVHGLSQAFMKRGLPRALMTDNGAAMLSEEVTTGLAALGVVHQTTLCRTERARIRTPSRNPSGAAWRAG